MLPVVFTATARISIRKSIGVRLTLTDFFLVLTLALTVTVTLLQ